MRKCRVERESRGPRRLGPSYGITNRATPARSRGWAREHGFQGSRRMREEIGCRSEEVSFAWGPYLYPDLDDGTTEADELAAIGAGEIRATRISDT